MTVGSEAPDPADMSAEQFAVLVAAWEEPGIIEEGLRAAGIDAVLDRVFGEMCERFRPDRAEGVDATIQWRLHVRGDEHPWIVRIVDGSCEAWSGRVEDPTVSFRARLGTFARLITSQADPMKLVLTRRLKVRGNLLLARRVPTFFEMPRA